MAEYIKEPSFSVILKDEFVVVEHNGKPFDQHDVEKLTSFAYQAGGESQGKGHRTDKTGYKGMIYIFFIPLFTI